MLLYLSNYLLNKLLKMKHSILSFLLAFTVLVGLQAQDLQLNDKTDGTTLASTNNLITPGDANCDGVVDILDVITISNYILGLNPEPFCFNNADLNNDGMINLNDLIATVNIIVGGSGFTCGISTVIDIDGNEYNTVFIGDQCWMSENLNTGIRIDGSITQTDNDVIEKYCYDDSEANCDIYGGLYQWNEMMQYSTTPGVRGICPEGWHLPTDAEWSTLIQYVSNQPEYLCDGDTNYIAKALAATTHWDTISNTCAIGNDLLANNATGFSALPGGGRSTIGSFVVIGNDGFWWSSTEFASMGAWGQIMYYNHGYVYHNNGFKTTGFSVRCLRD